MFIMNAGNMTYTSEEQESGIGARLMNLFSLPSRTFELPVETDDGDIDTIQVKMRLLNDRENQEVTEIADKYGLASRMINERRGILARCIISIEKLPIEMPSSMVQAITEQTGRPPTEVVQRLWVLEQCQGVLLNNLISFYDQLAEEQLNEVATVKKKFEQLSVNSQPETKLYE